MRTFGRGILLLVLGAGCAPQRPATVVETPPAAEERTAAGLTAAPLDGDAPSSPWLGVRDVHVEPAGNGRRVTIALTRAPDEVHDAMLANPARLVLDLAGPRPKEAMPVSRFPLTDDVVSQMRVGSHGGSLRAVLDLSHDASPHRVRRDGTRLVVDLGDTGPAETASAPPAAPEATPEAAPVEAVTAAPAPEVSSPFLSVRDVRVEPSGTGRRVTIALSRAPDSVQDFALGTPPRLVIDLAGPREPGSPRESRFPVSDAIVSRVRVAPFGDKLRIVVDLHRNAGAHAVHPQGTTLIADVGDTAASAAPTLSPMVAMPVADEAPPAGTHAEAEDATPPPADVAAADPLPPVAEPPPPPPVLDPPPQLPAPGERHVAPTKVKVADDGEPAFNGQRISLDFKDADIQNVLRVLADVSKLNIIATDDVKGKVTLHLVDVPWDQALDLVLRSNRLEMTQHGNVVRISTVSRLKEERESLRAAQDAERELEPLHVKYMRVNYARADETLIDKVKGVLTDRGSVTFDDRTNTIIVRDIDRGIADASTLVRELDTQSPQVLIEANIVEATEDFARGLGVQWGYQYNAGPLTGNPTGLNFPGQVGVGGGSLGTGTAPPLVPGQPATGAIRTPIPFLADFPVPAGFGSGFGGGTGSALNLALGSLDGTQSLTARLTALEEQGKAKVISRPRVITMNNVAATIQSLTILRVKLPSTGTVVNTGTGGVAGSATNATEKINTGITLVVTPQISQDGYVLMSIYAKSSQPDFSRTVDGIPNEVSREANSNVLIGNGQTVVLGGIFRNTSDDRESGIPYLRRVPALGWLFKRVLNTQHHEELLVFLTPKVVTTGTARLPSVDRLWEERRQGG